MDKIGYIRELRKRLCGTFVANADNSVTYMEELSNKELSCVVSYTLKTDFSEESLRNDCLVWEKVISVIRRDILGLSDKITEVQIDLLC